MDLRFLGGASQVGSLGLVVKDRSQKLLFDYGMTPSDPPEYPLPLPPDIQYCFLTHAHLDHSGMTPRVSRETAARVVTTTLTEEIAEFLLLDALKVAKSEGYPEPFHPGDIRHLMERTVGIDRKGSFTADGLQVDLTPAGHIPGASMFLYRGSRDILFTGDVQGLPTHLVEGAHPVSCDVLVMESTYAGREHPDRRETEARFVRQIETVVEDGGKVLVPAFAVGRCQEVMMALAGTDLDVWVDGMARSINQAYDANPEYLRDAREFRRALHHVSVVEESFQRKRALREADVIITTGGMLDGGPVLYYLGRMYKDPKNAVYLTGYQVEGSNGRQLVEKGSVEVDGVTIRPSCEIASFDFSAHSGHSELLRMARVADPKTIILMHGDHRELLAQELSSEYEVLLPQNGESFTL